MSLFNNIFLEMMTVAYRLVYNFRCQEFEYVDLLTFYRNVLTKTIIMQIFVIVTGFVRKNKIGLSMDKVNFVNNHRIINGIDKSKRDYSNLVKKY